MGFKVSVGSSVDIVIIKGLGCNMSAHMTSTGRMLTVGLKIVMW